MALGAVPVYLLARDRLENGWLGVVVAACFLLYLSLEWINWWHFHPDALVITPLLFAWWLATRRRWGWYAVAVGVALACKEDAALAVIMLGLVLAARRAPGRPGHRRRRGRLVPARHPGPDPGRRRRGRALYEELFSASATRWARSSGPWPSTRSYVGPGHPARPGGLLLARARAGGLLSAGRPAGPAHLAAADGFVN